MHQTSQPPWWPDIVMGCLLAWLIFGNPSAWAAIVMLCVIGLYELV